MINFTKLEKYDTYLVELPNYNNNDFHNIEYDICASFGIKNLIESCKSLKIVLLIDYQELSHDKRNSLK